MCLIDSVEFWDEHSIECLSRTHLDRLNPLRTNGELSSIQLLEYGAQAMALHGGLLNCSASRGRLAAFRNVQLYVDTLENPSGSIRITAIAEGNSSNTAVYRFEVSDQNGSVLVAARATVINA
jgi:predicted hotdog family 3-hydroxylacyl-ACP dehydratase